jgi:hypothetical protein
LNDGSFDSLSRQTAGGISRRTSLMSLGAAGLMAALAGPLTADAAQVSADKKRRKKKNKKSAPLPPPDLCAPQVGACTQFINSVCSGAADCLDSLQCCSHLGTCDAGGFFSCLVITA